MKYKENNGLVTIKLLMITEQLMSLYNHYPKDSQRERCPILWIFAPTLKVVIRDLYAKLSTAYILLLMQTQKSDWILLLNATSTAVNLALE